LGELLLHNAKVYTSDPQNPRCEAIAVKDGVITAIGGEELRLNAGPDAEVMDAKGRLVLPGFIDSHCHPSLTVYRAALDLSSCGTIVEYQSAIRRYAREHPELPVIKGAGWFYTDFGGEAPHRSLIDAAVHDRPVMIYSGDFHSLWVNSKALEAAGLDDSVENPEGGVIARDENGRLTGYFNETPAVKVIENRLSAFGPEDYKEGIKKFFRDANSVGITAVHDAGVLFEEGWGGYGLMREDEYSLGVFLSNVIEPRAADALREAVALTVKRKAAFENAFVRLNTVKLFMDGVPEANTAVLEEDYLNEPGNAGKPQWNLDAFDEACRLADAAGWQLHVHCIGDRALRYTLDAFQKAEKANGKRDSRHIAAHLQLVNESDIPRMRELGVTAMPTAFWFEKSAMYYEVELNNLGKERADREYPMKSLFDAGVLTACGSDSPVSITTPVLDVDFAPLQAIQQGVLRANPLSDPHDMKNVSNPGERVNLERMIAAYTINGARANFAEDRMGSITPGKEANFIILDQNIFEIPPALIYKTRVLATYFRGKPVWGGAGTL
jgi:predicted amidohydrolase YtcJ